jgi:F0F1-type ATP synthase assembly protein I
MKLPILLVLMACLAAGANAGYYLARLFYHANTSWSLAVGALLGATLGVLLLSKPAMKLVVRSLQDRQRLRLKILSLAGIVLLLFLLAAFNLKNLK